MSVTAKELRAAIDNGHEGLGLLRKVSGVAYSETLNKLFLKASRKVLLEFLRFRNTGDSDVYTKLEEWEVRLNKWMDCLREGRTLDITENDLERLYDLLSWTDKPPEIFSLPDFSKHKQALVMRGEDNLNAIQYALAKYNPKAFQILWSWYVGLGLHPKVLMDVVPQTGVRQKAGAGAGAGAGAAARTKVTDDYVAKSGPQYLLRWVLAPLRWKSLARTHKVEKTRIDKVERVDELLLEGSLRTLFRACDGAALVELYADSRHVTQSILHRVCELCISPLLREFSYKLTAAQLRTEDAYGQTVLTRALSGMDKTNPLWLLDLKPPRFFEQQYVFTADQKTSAAFGEKSYFSLAAMFGHTKALEKMFKSLAWAGNFMGSSVASLALCRQAYIDAVCAGNKAGAEWLLRQNQGAGGVGEPVFPEADRQALYLEALKAAFRYATERGVSATENGCVKELISSNLPSHGNTMHAMKCAAYWQQFGCVSVLNGGSRAQFRPIQARVLLCESLHGKTMTTPVEASKLPVAGKTFSAKNQQEWMNFLIAQADSLIKPGLHELVDGVSVKDLNAVMLAARVGGAILDKVLDKAEELTGQRVKVDSKGNTDQPVKVDSKGNTALNYAMAARRIDSMEKLGVAGYCFLELKDVGQFLDVFGGGVDAWPAGAWADRIELVVGNVFLQCESATEVTDGLNAQLDQVVAFAQRYPAIKAHPKFDQALVYAARNGLVQHLTALLNLFDESESRAAKAGLVLSTAEAGPKDQNGAQSVLACLNAGAEIVEASYAVLVKGAADLATLNGFRVNGQSVFALACAQGGTAHLEALYNEADGKFGSGNTGMLWSSSALTASDFVYQGEVNSIVEASGAGAGAGSDDVPRVGGSEPFVRAAELGDLAQVNWLLEKGMNVNVNVQDAAGQTALMAAVAAGHGAVVEALLDQADINVLLTNVDGKTAVVLSTNEDAGFHRKLQKKTALQESQTVSARASSLLTNLSSSAQSLASKGAIYVTGKLSTRASEVSGRLFGSAPVEGSQNPDPETVEQSVPSSPATPPAAPASPVDSPSQRISPFHVDLSPVTLAQETPRAPSLSPASPLATRLSALSPAPMAVINVVKDGGEIADCVVVEGPSSPVAALGLQPEFPPSPSPSIARGPDTTATTSELNLVLDLAPDPENKTATGSNVEDLLGDTRHAGEGEEASGEEEVVESEQPPAEVTNPVCPPVFEPDEAPVEGAQVAEGQQEEVVVLVEEREEEAEVTSASAVELQPVGASALLAESKREQFVRLFMYTALVGTFIYQFGYHWGMSVSAIQSGLQLSSVNLAIGAIAFAVLALAVLCPYKTIGRMVGIIQPAPVPDVGLGDRGSATGSGNFAEQVHALVSTGVSVASSRGPTLAGSGQTVV